ncbi:hypothetical protein EHO98_17620 [Leptospira stimsonii]|uniref:Uncharacterized protein n=1 Tax=Leptospira stimsonii TaxID=2202203 RepID=A0ABY2NDU4_9LEPT|nr:hypothetical protein EHO98_17620 [Leptospira stimsonii]TGM22059.1 hypothetical protein EHQ90_01090 [Leptospira stimsonii]
MQISYHRMQILGFPKKRVSSTLWIRFEDESGIKVKFLERQASPKIQCGSRFYLFSNPIGN